MSKITTTKIKNSETTTQSVEASFYETVDKVTDFIEKNSMILVVGFFGLMVGCAGYFGISYYLESAALKKFDSAFVIEKKISEFAINEMDTSEKVKTKKTPETDAVDFNQVNKDVLEFVKNNPSNSASRNLVLKWSNYLYSVEKFDMAYETLNAFKLKKGNSLEGLAALAKAATTVQLGKTAEAIDLYKNIISTPKWKYLHPEARFQMSLALLSDNKENEAIENLKTIQIEHPKERKTVEEASKIIRWLTYKKNKE